jgi:hypothetical protein
MTRPLTLLATALLASACASSTPQEAPAAAPAPVSSAVPAGSDLCYLTVAEALGKPDIPVEKVPEPIEMKPPAFKAPYPRGVFQGKGNWMQLKIHVLVDTLGRPDMSTFVVDSASHQWFATQTKANLAKWKFRPAEKSGCKIPRNYNLGITMGTKTAK